MSNEFRRVHLLVKAVGWQILQSYRTRHLDRLPHAQALDLHGYPVQDPVFALDDRGLHSSFFPSGHQSLALGRGKNSLSPVSLNSITSEQAVVFSTSKSDDLRPCSLGLARQGKSCPQAGSGRVNTSSTYCSVRGFPSSPAESPMIIESDTRHNLFLRNDLPPNFWFRSPLTRPSRALQTQTVEFSGLGDHRLRGCGQTRKRGDGRRTLSRRKSKTGLTICW